MSQLQCARCRLPSVDEKLFPTCCKEHQLCVKCTARVINGKYGHQTCYCCYRHQQYNHILEDKKQPEQVSQWADRRSPQLDDRFTTVSGKAEQSSLTVGVQSSYYSKKEKKCCEKVNIDTYHYIDHITFREPKHFSVFAFPVDFTHKHFIDFDMESATWISNRLKDAKLHVPLYKYEVPIEIKSQLAQTDQNKKVVKSIQYAVSSQLSGLLNSLGEIKPLSPQLLVDFVFQNRKYIEKYLEPIGDSPQLHKVKLHRKPDKLVIKILDFQPQILNSK